MAQKATIHRINIDLSDTDRHVYEKIAMSVARADSETPHRLLARLLGYCLCYEEHITFTQGVCAGDEPDAWVVESGGRVKLWLEVGLPEVKRLVKASRHCRRVVLLAYGKKLMEWQRDELGELEGAENVTIAAFDLAFLEKLVAKLDRTINWSLTISGGTLYLTWDKDHFETTLTHVFGPPVFGE
jgi:uncharacterized protein YaeQ